MDCCGDPLYADFISFVERSPARTTGWTDMTPACSAQNLRVAFVRETGFRLTDVNDNRGSAVRCDWAMSALAYRLRK